MNTYSPISGMIICQNDTGDYVAKPDYDALIQTLAQERQRRETAEAELKAYSDAVDAQPWATDEPIRVMLDRVTERMQKAEHELAKAHKRCDEMLSALRENEISAAVIAAENKRVGHVYAIERDCRFIADRAATAREAAKGTK